MVNGSTCPPHYVTWHACCVALCNIGCPLGTLLDEIHSHYEKVLDMVVM